MAGDKRDRGNARQQAAQELDRCEVDLLTVGALFAQAVEAHGENMFALAGEVLSEESSPKTWIRDGVASWFRCFETQVDLYKGLCEVACPSHADTEETQDCTSGRRGQDVFFCLDAYAEGTDPIATDIPPGSIPKVTVSSGTRLAPHIRLTESNIGGTRTVLVGLVGLLVTPDPLPPGHSRAATLRWSVDGSSRKMKVIAVRQGPSVD